MPKPTSVYVGFPPIPEALVSSVSFGSPHQLDSQRFLRQMRKSMSRLDRLVNEYRLKSEASPSDCKFAGAARTPALQFLQIELARLHRQHQVEARGVFADLFTWLSITSLCFRSCFDAKLFVSFDFTAIDRITEEAFRKNAAYQAARARVLALEAALSRVPPERKTLAQITRIAAQSLKCAATKYSQHREFAYSSAFDGHLLDYLAAIGMDEVDRVAQAISPHLTALTFSVPPVNVSFKVRPLLARRSTSQKLNRPGWVKRPELEPLNQLYLRVIEALSADTPEKQVVVKCALLRIVADRLYLVDPLLNAPNASIEHGLTMIRQMKVEDMHVSDGLWDSSRHELIGDLPHTNAVISEVASFLDGMQFSTSPFDIAEAIATVSTTIHAMARTEGEKGLDMCFDEFFAIFVVLFAAAPPINAVGIAELFGVFAGLEFPGVLKHAVTAFCAWVEFVEGFRGSD
jgi:hypothetical protein